MSDFQIDYTMLYKSTSSPKFQSFANSGDDSFVNDTVSISEIPTILQLNLRQILPNNPRATKQVLYDGVPVLSSDDKTFEFKVDTAEDHTITILVEDKTT
ncbi:TPA: hypothetical protein DEP21_04140 [Patescibacteria group bacterium]|nr:hypothetical protein [Candidatus Gracilibacteria bacterium]